MEDKNKITCCIELRKVVNKEDLDTIIDYWNFLKNHPAVGYIFYGGNIAPMTFLSHIADIPKDWNVEKWKKYTKKQWKHETKNLK